MKSVSGKLPAIMHCILKMNWRVKWWKWQVELLSRKLCVSFKVPKIWKCWKVRSKAGRYSKLIRFIVFWEKLTICRKIYGKNTYCKIVCLKKTFPVQPYTHIQTEENAVLPDYCRPGRRSAGWWSIGSPHLPTRPAPPENMPSKQRRNKL